MVGISREAKYVKKFFKSPILFVEEMWGLVPQPLKEEYKEKALVVGLKEFKVDWFEPFIRGKHITWQQWVILLAIEKAMRGAAPKRLSVASGHGIGKDTVLSWLILWYLFCFPDAQVPCTAPTAEQIHDILWKEIKIWMDRMPTRIIKNREVKMSELYDWTVGYIRMWESPQTWFARARTARKENPEALAGVHGDFVFLAIDEASGVPNEIFKPAEGALTNENVLAVMLSNPRRLIGYFYDSQHRDKFSWQVLSFDSNDSPIVDKSFIERIIQKYGKDSDEYSYMVAGKFPKEDTLDEKGYVALLVDDDIKETTDQKFVQLVKLGIDPAGEGKSETAWVARDRYKMKVLAKEKTSTGKSIAQKTITLCGYLGIKKRDARKRVIVDAFGLGVEAVRELALAGWNVLSVNVGEQPDGLDDKKMYLNKRGMAYDRLKKWLRAGGEVMPHSDWKPQLLAQRYRRERSGKMRMMPKLELKNLGVPNVDVADASMLTFILPDEEIKEPYKQKPHEPISQFEGR